MSNGMIFFIMLTFVAVFFLVQGLAIPVFGESAQARKRLKKKLSEIESANDEEAYSSILRAKYLRKLSPWASTSPTQSRFDLVHCRLSNVGCHGHARREAFR